jgi:Zn finger protein HypA/HybF involved in hydrogenase expression
VRVHSCGSLLAVAALFVAGFCYAGVEQQFVCKHCEFKGTYVQGALLTADQFVAFCPKDHFVHIAWNYHKRAPKPVRFDGTVPVYTCPVCKKPIARRWNEKKCPRCGSKDIRIRLTGMAVD